MKARNTWIVLGLALCSSVLWPTAGLAADKLPQVVPPGETYVGLTHGEWSAKWWRWALEVSAAESPLGDQTGANCSVGQAGDVWFLAGTLGPGDPVTRRCSIPYGKALFFPAVNAFCVAEGNGTFEAQRLCAEDFLNTFTSFAVEVDGHSIDLSASRAQSPAFDLILPGNNIFAAPGGVYTPTAADGYYVLLEPLSRGSHEVRITAVSDAGSIDVVYNLTVTGNGR